jgi:hypothetical protein
LLAGTQKERNMSKASDLRNKLGGNTGLGSATGPAKFNPFSAAAAEDAKEDKKDKAIDPHIKSGEIDKGHDAGKGAHKARGGAGGAGGRPKV